MKGIVFRPELVAVLLDRGRIQTRRVMRPQPPSTHRLWGKCFDDGEAMFTDHPQGEKGDVRRYRGFYGGVGTKLYVKEGWGYAAKLPVSAHDEAAWLAYPDLRAYRGDNPDGHWCWKSPLFMPEWASRAKVRVARVDVQRLGDMTEADAVACGIDWQPGQRSAPVLEYSILWNRINGKKQPWHPDLWTWVYELEVVTV